MVSCGTKRPRGQTGSNGARPRHLPPHWPVGWRRFDLILFLFGYYFLGLQGTETRLWGSNLYTRGMQQPCLPDIFTESGSLPSKIKNRERRSHEKEEAKKRPFGGDL